MFSYSDGIYTVTAGGMTYAFAEDARGALRSLYWGAALCDAEALCELRDGITSAARPVPTPYEYPTGEGFDYSEPCLRVRFADGSQTVRLRVADRTVTNDTLTVTLREEQYPLKVRLVYRTWGDLPLVGRSAEIVNEGGSPVTLESALSASFFAGRGRPVRLTHLSGAWSSEYRPQREMLTQGRTVLEASYLTEAACYQVPFFALDENASATEFAGEVRFGALSWSGDFRITAEKRTEGIVTVAGGVNPETARIPLAPGQSFETPVFTAGFAAGGFARMSEILYDWQLDWLLPRGRRTDKAHAERPIIYNSWYPYTFDVNEENLLALVPKAKAVGAELFVIDDGWMPGRTDECKGLGDWVVDAARFPHGLGCIAGACHKAGMLFGLWVEPEMCNPDSDIYRAHPDWIVRDPGRTHSLKREQCILDFSRDEIRDWAIGWLSSLIEDAGLDYLKWDMNRTASELPAGWRESGAAVKYIQNVYAVWERLNARFPDLLLENCASGGGRADFGMVPYSDRVNRSDNAEPVDVMQLHEGYTMLFAPKLAGGAGNVAPSPIRGRAVPLEFRCVMGMTGSMSIGIDLLKSPPGEQEQLRAATDRFKRVRKGLQDSYVYRIASSHEGPYCVWQYCRRDRREFSVFGFGHGMHMWEADSLPRMRMHGLIPGAVYVSDEGVRRTGDALMHIGVKVPLAGDCASYFSHWTAEK